DSEPGDRARVDVDELLSRASAAHGGDAVRFRPGSGAGDDGAHGEGTFRLLPPREESEAVFFGSHRGGHELGEVDDRSATHGQNELGAEAASALSDRIGVFDGRVGADAEMLDVLSARERRADRIEGSTRLSRSARIDAQDLLSPRHERRESLKLTRSDEEASRNVIFERAHGLRAYLRVILPPEPRKKTRYFQRNSLARVRAGSCSRSASCSR